MEDYLDLDLPHWSLDREPRWRITWLDLPCWSLDREPWWRITLESDLPQEVGYRASRSVRHCGLWWRWSTWAQVLEAHTFGYINNCRQHLHKICRGTMVWQHLLAMKAMVRLFAVAKKIFPFLEFFSFSIWWCSILLCIKIIFPLLNFALFNLLFRKIYLSVY